MNTFGDKLRLTTFGESHGPAMGGILDGMPPMIPIDFKEINNEVAKRSPGSSILVTQRKESDSPEFLSGLSPEGITLGTPIGFIIRNNDTRSSDYSDLADKFRPNHADFTYSEKYHITDHRGGGRSSARETANWVVGGALVQQFLSTRFNIEIHAVLSGVGKVSYTSQLIDSLCTEPFSNLSLDIPDIIKKEMEGEILKAKEEGDSVGGTVTCVINGVKPGKGNPVFGKMHARLAEAMMSINAAKGFEYGLGYKAAQSRGIETLDIFDCNDEKREVLTKTNYSGGIQGGISNGMPIFFNVHFKPTPTVMRELPTVNKEFEHTTLKMRGRHDPCVAVRAVPVVKAMATLVVGNFYV